MKKYIGIKLVQAEPMNQKTFEETIKQKNFPEDWPNPLGYKIVYPDGYISWSPKEVFEKAYMQIGDNNTIIETNVNDFVKNIDYSKWGDKTTVAHATLANGFIITESSSCVDPANFNMDIGSNICRENIYNRVWKHLGFLLQCALKGIK
jgi:hypothetical protein